MVEALYLQAPYDLSGPGLEEALLDRLSFRRFCGFALDAGTPDETTLCRFRAAAAASDVLERCLAEINRQLDAQGLVLRRGTILDASVVRATRNPPRGAGIAPGDRHPHEPGADGTRKDGKAVFGDRFHIGIDEGSGLIRARRNRLIGKRRAPVEAVFSAMKRLYGKARTRCLSIERDTADFLAFATIYNPRRAAILTAA